MNCTLIDLKGGRVPKNHHKAVESMSHAVVSVVLHAIRRNGLEKTLEDLNAHCQHRPESDEVVYQGMLKMVKSSTEDRKRTAESKT